MSFRMTAIGLPKNWVQMPSRASVEDEVWAQAKPAREGRRSTAVLSDAGEPAVSDSCVSSTAACG